MVFAPAWPPRAAARWSLPGADTDASGSVPDPSVVPMERLRRRAGVLAAASAAKLPTAAFVLQVRRRGEKGPVRVGFTVSRRVGTAVERNRVRRRLKETVRLAARAGVLPGNDFCVGGRPRATS